MQKCTGWEILARVNFSDSRYSRDSRGEPCNFNYIFIEKERIYPWMIDNARGVILARNCYLQFIWKLHPYPFVSLFQGYGTSRSVSNPFHPWKYTYPILLHRALMSDHMHPFRLTPLQLRRYPCDGTVRRVFSPPPSPKKGNEIGK